MDSETLFKEAFKCFNSKNGDCPISYSDPHLFDRCFYCLKNIQRLKPPENIKKSNLSENIKAKKENQKLF